MRTVIAKFRGTQKHVLAPFAYAFHKRILGAQGTLSPFGPNCLHFHAVFRKNWSHSRLVFPQGWCSPLGNSGSATGFCVYWQMGTYQGIQGPSTSSDRDIDGRHILTGLNRLHTHIHIPRQHNGIQNGIAQCEQICTMNLQKRSLFSSVTVGVCFGT